MKFRFYIVSVFDGNVSGTNDEKVARDFAGSSDDFVIDVKNSAWLQEDEDTAIPEWKPHKPKKAA